MITSGDSANLVKIADNLKGLTDNALEREKQNPNGFAPVYMIVSEQSRRKKLRDKYPGDPQTTVAQDLSMASQAYQGQDALTGIMAGGQPPMMQQPQMAAYGGLMGYNEGGLVGYFDGKLVPPEEEEERMSGLARLLQGPEGARERYEENQARIRERNRIINEGTGEGFLAGLFKNETDAEYQARMARNKEREQALRDTYKTPGKSKYDKTTMDAFNLGLKAPIEGTGTGTGTSKSTGKGTGIDTGAGAGAGKKGGQPTPPPNPFAELLKQEYEMSKKAYADQQAQKSQAGKLAAIMGGLTLAGTGSLAKAGIAGLDAFQGEKDKRRNQLAQLAKQRSDAARGYASGMLDLEKLGVEQQKLRQTARFNAKKLEAEYAKADTAKEKNKVKAVEIILDQAFNNGQALTYAQAERQYDNLKRNTPIGRSETRNLTLGK